jgi:hypothetical protein
MRFSAPIRNLAPMGRPLPDRGERLMGWWVCCFQLRFGTTAQLTIIVLVLVLDLGHAGCWRTRDLWSTAPNPNCAPRPRGSRRAQRWEGSRPRDPPFPKPRPSLIKGGNTSLAPRTPSRRAGIRLRLARTQNRTVHDGYVGQAARPPCQGFLGRLC